MASRVPLTNRGPIWPRDATLGWAERRHGLELGGEIDHDLAPVEFGGACGAVQIQPRAGLDITILELKAFAYLTTSGHQFELRAGSVCVARRCNFGSCCWGAATVLCIDPSWPNAAARPLCGRCADIYSRIGIERWPFRPAILLPSTALHIALEAAFYLLAGGGRG